MGAYKWKVDWDKMIIFISHEVTNQDLLSLMNELLQDERGLPAGPEVKWVIITAEEN